ncbi:MAG: alkaline phosphatase family protein [Actinomycetota bacterium]|nr:alkaline phosphatase family protein [Actinomycetota bacterium]
MLAALPASARPQPPPGLTTPIEHVVVLFQENVSFDHYFGTYPNAPGFAARADTPTVNGLNGALLQNNPNSAQPMPLARTEALTCDQDHGYKNEQLAFDKGLMDKFVEFTDKESCTAPRTAKPGLVMDYYDGTTVTALWNYAQRYAMSDNSYNTTFGPSTPGALNLVSGQTHGVTAANGPSSAVENGTVIGDPQPLGDKCSTRDAVQLSGRNVGDQLNEKGISWGWFQGGFADCNAAHTVGQATQGQQTGETTKDYIPHHEPFQYYASTANPAHLRPSSPAMIGRSDQANHQYDLSDFWTAADNRNMPAVSFLKAPAYQDGHAGYSDPLDEQTFLVNTINHLQQLKEWRNTAVVIAYDDSDGWYDHQMSPIVNQSQAPSDALTAPGACGTADKALSGYQDRCGYGPRLPLLVVSPFARPNFVDHGITDQSSILRFVQDNWKLGRIGGGSFDQLAGSLAPMFDFGRAGARERLVLDPASGQPAGRVPGRR